MIQLVYYILMNLPSDIWLAGLAVQSRKEPLTLSRPASLTEERRLLVPGETPVPDANRATASCSRLRFLARVPTATGVARRDGLNKLSRYCWPTEHLFVSPLLYRRIGRRQRKESEVRDKRVERNKKRNLKFKTKYSMTSNF